MSKLANRSRGRPEVPFSIAITLLYKGGAYSFPRIASLTLDPYLIVLSVKQRGIKYHFLSLWYDLTWDWTTISRTIDKHTNYYGNWSRGNASRVRVKVNSWIEVGKQDEIEGETMRERRSHTHTCAHAHTHTYTHAYIYINIYILKRKKFIQLVRCFSDTFLIYLCETWSCKWLHLLNFSIVYFCFLLLILPF